MVVLFEELKVKSISDLTLEDDDDLRKSFFGVLLGLVCGVDGLDLGSDQVSDVYLECLVLLVTDVKGDLVRIKICMSIGLNQIFKKRSSSFWKIEEELALSNLVVVEIALMVLVLVNKQKKAENVGSEVLALDNIECDSESIREVILDLVA